MHTIQTQRLELRLMDIRFLDLCLAGRREGAERYANAILSDEWMQSTRYAKMRRDQLVADPAYAPWCMRMILLKENAQMVGRIGFHTPPDPPALADITAGGVELGYEIDPAHRRKGYAREALIGIMDWAATTHGIQKFVASISPQNHASQALAKSLGFLKVAEQMDEIDGPEDVLVRLCPATPSR